MKKIISVWQRNYDGDHLIRNEVVPGAEWVLAGEGVATIKFDGTCVLIRSGQMFKRYDAKHGKPPPPNFEPAQEPDAKTGHWPGWVPVGDGPQDQWHREALRNGPTPEDGTYELCGPKIGGNPEELDQHVLWRHACELVPDFPRTFDGMREALRPLNTEGVVFHHPDGRMAKVKKKDFGLERKP